jgi:hypothetical protein
MTTNDDPLARRALFVVFEGMGVLDLTGLLTIFRSAFTFMKQQGTATPGIRSAPPAPCMRAAEPNVPESSPSIRLPRAGWRQKARRSPL